MDENILKTLCELFGYEEYVQYFNDHVYDTLEDFLKNGLEEFIVFAPDVIRAKSFTDKIKKKEKQNNQSVVTIEDQISIESIEEYSPIDLVNKVNNLEAKIQELNMQVGKILNVLSSNSRTETADGNIIIDFELKWIITQEELMASAQDRSNYDLSSLLDATCGRSLFEDNQKFDNLSQNMKDGLEKICQCFTKKKISLYGGSEKKLLTQTLARMKKRFTNLNRKRKRIEDSDQDQETNSLSDTENLNDTN
ncbi:hypothetical protein RDWZM_009871 [Blomia tropicalis]|uniref:Uncharacterized protein n=1 Tax=Blomia tropicalis TaxID=40697 RepID=A0A9Q0LYB1_BLOTA|nr:hypothetical protein BLOT_006641 [Blomia tropicalis]KAJ6215371.1 hypothetical protein RDWZM_009871 [Blomia tropicalis]